ncbi:fs-1-Ya [Drosophila busckii]|uniref:Fs-1-Ya n=1 Tax=Drosophila busckii TaxID=30019 RepID=A0A0M3QZ42_DROBS|nr:fs-1-Ya [Drosophila busckii]
MEENGHHDAETSTVTIYVFCPICEQKPLTLRKEMYPELLAHIESAHLPLRCRKCQRRYIKIDDLSEFSRCADLAQNCSSTSCDTDASKVTVKKASTMATQTSPIHDSQSKQLQQPLQHSQLSPISMFNMRWKAKSRLAQEGEFISDSVSSIRNLSSDSDNTSMQRRSIGQLTSSTAIAAKSIKKAFVEHGVEIAAAQENKRKMRLDLSDSSSFDASSALDLRLSPVVRRTQSEIINSKQESYQVLLSAQKLTTESIIITRRSLPSASEGASSTSTVYNSCESVKIISSASSSSTELSTNLQLDYGIPPITPITRIPGAVISKKLIKFETPQKDDTQASQLNESSVEEKDIFYTPIHDSPNKQEKRREKIVPRQLSGEFSPAKKQIRLLEPPQGPRARPPLRVCHNHKSFSSCVQDLDEDEVFLIDSHDDKQRVDAVAQPAPVGGRLWSLMSSVMGLSGARKADPENKNSRSGATGGPKSLIRRCASIAGSLVRTKHDQDKDEMQSLKRKRTQTLDNQYYSSMSPARSTASKRLRIQGRKPVERMRNT